LYVIDQSKHICIAPYVTNESEDAELCIYFYILGFTKPVVTRNCSGAQWE